MRASDEQAVRDSRPRRDSVDLAGYPDLVVVYLGFRVGSPERSSSSRSFLAWSAGRTQA